MKPARPRAAVRAARPSRPAAIVRSMSAVKRGSTQALTAWPPMTTARTSASANARPSVSRTLADGSGPVEAEFPGTVVEGRRVFRLGARVGVPLAHDHQVDAALKALVKGKGEVLGEAFGVGVIDDGAEAAHVGAIPFRNGRALRRGGGVGSVVHVESVQRAGRRGQGHGLAQPRALGRE